MVGWSFWTSKAGITTFVKVWLKSVSPVIFLISLWRYSPLYLDPVKAFVVFMSGANIPLQIILVLLVFMSWSAGLAGDWGRNPRLLKSPTLTRFSYIYTLYYMHTYGNYIDTKNQTYRPLLWKNIWQVLKVEWHNFFGSKQRTVISLWIGSC